MQEYDGNGLSEWFIISNGFYFFKNKSYNFNDSNNIIILLSYKLYIIFIFVIYIFFIFYVKFEVR